jgi:hypothetical protein
MTAAEVAAISIEKTAIHAFKMTADKYYGEVTARSNNLNEYS